MFLSIPFYLVSLSELLAFDSIDVILNIINYNQKRER